DVPDPAEHRDDGQVAPTSDHARERQGLVEASLRPARRDESGTQPMASASTSHDSAIAAPRASATGRHPANFNR
ncbi:MAG: hypothetical protein ACRDHU_03940, partial [Actinomycetota bacterium]